MWPDPEDTPLLPPLQPSQLCCLWSPLAAAPNLAHPIQSQPPSPLHRPPGGLSPQPMCVASCSPFSTSICLALPTTNVLRAGLTPALHTWAQGWLAACAELSGWLWSQRDLSSDPGCRAFLLWGPGQVTDLSEPQPLSGEMGWKHLTFAEKMDRA